MSPNTKNLTIAFLLCTTLGASAMLLYTRQQLADARLVPLQIARQERKEPAAPPPVVAAEPTQTAIPIVEAQVSEPAPGNAPEGGPGGGPGGFGGGRGGRFAAQMGELMKDPEFAEAWKIQQEARIEERYGALFKQLNLPPAKLAALKALLLERENAGREVFASAAAQGLNPRENRDELRKLTDDLRNEVNNNIATTLGTGVVAALDDFNKSAPQRRTAENISEKLANTNTPLNPMQNAELVKIITTTGKQSGRNVTITEETIQEAARVLGPSQVTVLKAMKVEQDAQMLIEAKMRAARENTRNPGNG